MHLLVQLLAHQLQLWSERLKLSIMKPISNQS